MRRPGQPGPLGRSRHGGEIQRGDRFGPSAPMPSDRTVTPPRGGQLSRARAPTPDQEYYVTAAVPTTPGLRTFVLDASVLLPDPGALGRFAEPEVVLPLVGISELEGKRHHPELGWFARQTLRGLDDLRIPHGRLDPPVPGGGDGA